MKYSGFVASLLVSALAASAANAAESKPAAPEASIPFVQHGAIDNWKADGNQGVWIQDNGRRWFYAQLMGPCIGLNSANSIGFDARPTGTLDRFGAIIVPRGGMGRCMIKSLVPSEGPPKKKSSAKQSDAPAEKQGS